MAFSTNLLAAVFTAMLFMLTFHSCGVSAQAPGPAPEASTDCTTQLVTLSDCLTYVEEGSNLTKPDKACCPELAVLVKSTPQCLCYLLQKNSTSNYGIEIDLNKALHLPSVCKVETPPTSACALLGIPVEAPMASEGPTANSPVQAPGPAPEASTDCTTQLVTLSDCLTYVEEGSNLTKPDKACCPELAALVKSTPQCLCYLLQKNSTSNYGIEIDLNKALHLPSVCKVETPPTSACALLGIPVEAPMASEGPTANSPAGSELAPQGPSASQGNQADHGASTTAKSLMALFIGLAISLPTFF